MEIVKLPEELAQISSGVSAEKRNEVQTVLNQVFQGVSKMRTQLDKIEISDENDKVSMQMARTVRLAVREDRLNAEKIFDAKRSEVQQAMLGFKTEDSLWLKAKQTMQILTKEIEETAKWKEETKTRFDAEQKELKIQQRINKISKFSDIGRQEFENMSDETFEMFLSGIEKQYNDRIQAEKKAELDRIEKEKAEIAERERIRLENEKLKKEAEEKAKELEAELQDAELEKKAIEEKAKKEKAVAKAEVERLEAKYKAKVEAEREAEAKRIKELQDAELKAKKEAEKLAKAPVKKQLLHWIDSFDYEKSDLIEKETICNSILLKFQGFKDWAKKEVESL